MELTAENLIAATRNATSLGELKRLAGPSEGEKEAARRRLNTLDLINKACKWNETCPDEHVRDARGRWNRIMIEQGKYEGLYC